MTDRCIESAPRCLFLFGAGASYGSQTCARPPLGGCDLFNALVGCDPAGWGKLNTDLAKIFRNDFEEGMAQIVDTRRTALQLALARYLFGFEPSDGNLYFKLAKRIRRYRADKGVRWPGAFATLNYDRLLQSALTRAGLHFDLYEGFLDAFEMCAPHGLCNLFPSRVRYDPNVSIDPRNPMVVFEAGSRIEFDKSPVLLESPSDFALAASWPFPPVMSYYEPLKESTVQMEWLEDRRDRFTMLVRSAEKIAIIGVRVHAEVDQHIWAPLADTPATLLYCSGNADDFRKWRLKVQRNNSNDIALDGLYFKEGFSEILEFAGLG